MIHPEELTLIYSYFFIPSLSLAIALMGYDFVEKLEFLEAFVA